MAKDNSISVNMECRPYSVGHAQEGVCLLVKIGPYRVLLDCGLTDMTNLLADFNDLSIVAVFCSHAHADHARGLLTLYEHFPQIPIYASKATSQLLPVNWPTEQTPADLCQSLAWQEILEIANGLTAQIFPVGHLPGAAGILLTYQGENSRTYKLFYTGDFFLSHSRLVEGFPLASLRGMKPDVLIIE
ncbi:MAG: MBL fold metallo-hydrolase, partial [Microcoleaceae cyanobacterium]